MLYYAHSGLRHLVLLLAVAALVALGHALATGRTTKAARALPAAFTGTLDLQLLLGILLLVTSYVVRDALVGHLVTMVLAVAVAHGSSVMAKRAANDRREVVIRLVGVSLTLVLVVVGILAIDRGVFESLAPSAR